MGFSGICSNQALNNQEDTHITPVYFLLHITDDYMIMPFIELGADFSALLLKGEYQNNGNTYIKQYRIGNSFGRQNNEDDYINDNRKQFNMIGVSLIIFFD